MFNIKQNSTKRPRNNILSHDTLTEHKIFVMSSYVTLVNTQTLTNNQQLTKITLRRHFDWCVNLY